MIGECIVSSSSFLLHHHLLSSFSSFLCHHFLIITSFLYRISTVTLRLIMSRSTSSCIIMYSICSLALQLVHSQHFVHRYNISVPAHSTSSNFFFDFKIGVLLKNMDQAAFSCLYFSWSAGSSGNLFILWQ